MYYFNRWYTNIKVKEAKETNLTSPGVFIVIFGLWYAPCIASLIPVFGAPFGVCIIYLVNALLCSFRLGEFAQWVCTYCYLDWINEDAIISVIPTDMFRIIILSILVHICLYIIYICICGIIKLIKYLMDKK